MENKHWFASKTLWVNGVEGVVTVARLLGFNMGLTP